MVLVLSVVLFGHCVVVGSNAVGVAVVGVIIVVVGGVGTVVVVLM